MAAAPPTLDELADTLVAARPPMRPVEYRTALALYRLLAEGAPLSDARLADALGLTEQETLAAWPAPFRDDNGDIIGFLALSLEAVSPHHYRTNGVPLFTWCAWDALFMPLLLDRDAEVESVDALTSEPIRLTVSPAGVERTSHADAVVSLLGLEGKFDLDVFTTFCHHVHFFTTRENGDRWAAQRDDAFLVSVADAFELGRRFIGPILAGAAHG